MKKKNIRYKKDVKNRTGLMLFLLFTCFTLCLSVGYAALNSDLKISGEANFRVQADIRITDILLYETTNLATENYTSKYSKDTITIGVGLKQIDSTISYKVKVQNNGTVAMWIDSIEEEAKNNSNTEYVLEGIGLKELINPGEEKEFIVKIKYKDNITTLPDNTNLDTILKFNFIKPESTLASGSNTNSASTFFNGPLKKEEIESIELRPTLDVIEDAIGSWDASYDKNGTVIASYKDSDGNGLYELYIGGIGEVNAPVNSSFLFYDFRSLTKINFDKYFNTSNAISMNSMFCSLYGTIPLLELDLSSFDTSKVTSMAYMFYDCKKLTNLDVSSFDTSNVTNMAWMFGGMSSLKSLDLSKFNTSKVTTMAALFYLDYALSELDISSFNTEKVNTMSDMFRGISVTALNLSNFDTSNVTDMTRMFFGCKKLTNLDVSSFDTSKVITMNAMFTGCSVLAELDVSNFDTSNVTNMVNMFLECTSLVNLDLSNFNTSKVTSMTQMFYNCSSLESLNVSSFDTSNVTSMSGMFRETKITTLDLSNFDTSKVTSMGGMFRYCHFLSSLNLSSFDTSNVTDMNCMFHECRLLTSLDLSNFNTSNVTNMQAMFRDCYKLTSIDLSSFDFTNVTSSSYMFYGNSKQLLIYVKDDVSKEFILGVRSDLTNVQIKDA